MTMIGSKATVLLSLLALAPISAAPGHAEGAGGHQGHQQHQGDDAQPYAGQQTRRIKSLSDADIAELRAGKGWGFALPAELNGWPGPAHLLELAPQIGLSETQIGQVRQIHREMATEAQQAAEVFIAAEERLDQAFASGNPDADELRRLVSEAGAARADLRYVHLSRHLQTVQFLSGEQIAAYNRLRGYAADPCDAVPEGHDPAMWQMHNNCE